MGALSSTVKAPRSQKTTKYVAVEHNLRADEKNQKCLCMPILIFLPLKTLSNAQKAAGHLCEATNLQQEFVDRVQFQAVMAYYYIMLHYLQKKLSILFYQANTHALHLTGTLSF